MVRVGETVTLAPRIGPGTGDMIRYEAPETVQESVVLCPAEIVVKVAVNPEIAGALPCGTFALV